MEIKFTLTFLREYYRIPKRMKLQWCIVEEVSRSRSGEPERELRPGVLLSGTNLYIDIAQRRFFSTLKIGNVSRTAHAAKRTGDGNHFVFSADGLTVRVDKNYVQDLYYTSVYREELLKTTLF